MSLSFGYNIIHRILENVIFIIQPLAHRFDFDFSFSHLRGRRLYRYCESDTQLKQSSQISNPSKSTISTDQDCQEEAVKPQDLQFFPMDPESAIEQLTENENCSVSANKVVRSINNEDIGFFNKFYSLHEVIGKGGFSLVRRAIHIMTGETVAIKIVDKLSNSNQDLSAKCGLGLDQELKLLRSFSHPNICKLYQEIHTPRYMFMILEYYGGGELFHYVQSRQRLNETESKRIFRQIASAVAYIHSKGVCHRDLKLENVLLDSRTNVKLIDFGLCAVYDLNSPTPLSLFCGSPAYAAPELVQSQPYIGFKSDVWSLGIILYCCLNGFFPFYSPDHNQLYTYIKAGIYEEPKWLSDPSKKFLRWLLQSDPDKRPSLEQILESSWCRERHRYRYRCGISWPLKSKSGSEHTTQEKQNSNADVNSKYFSRCKQLLDQDIDIKTLRQTAKLCNLSEEEVLNIFMEDEEATNVSKINFSSYELATYKILLDQNLRRNEGQGQGHLDSLTTDHQNQNQDRFKSVHSTNNSITTEKIPFPLNPELKEKQDLKQHLQLIDNQKGKGDGDFDHKKETNTPDEFAKSKYDCENETNNHSYKKSVYLSSQNQSRSPKHPCNYNCQEQQHFFRFRCQAETETKTSKTACPCAINLQDKHKDIGPNKKNKSLTIITRIVKPFSKIRKLFQSDQSNVSKSRLKLV